MRVYEFVECEKANHPVNRLCRVLGVAPVGIERGANGVSRHGRRRIPK